MYRRELERDFERYINRYKISLHRDTETYLKLIIVCLTYILIKILTDFVLKIKKSYRK
jgi:hypothetical protein